MPPARSPKPPDEAALHQAALAYLARYSATEAMLRRVLDRRVDRWARAQERMPEAAFLAEARGLVRAVVARLAASGAVNDAVFAAARAHSLSRAGRSRRAVAAHLAAKGVAADAARAALPVEENAELAAALSLVARRRIGTFRPSDAVPDAALRRRELGVLARAGFTQPIAARALETQREEAEDILRRLRQG